MNNGIDRLGDDDIVKVVLEEGVEGEGEEVILEGSVESSGGEDLVDEHLEDTLFEEKEIEGYI
jgi:hypothetical protein